MRLKQKTYKFASKDGTKPVFTQINSLKLVIDNSITDTSIKDLFEQYKVANDHIKGYSILEQVEQTDTSEENKNTSKFYTILKANDKEVSIHFASEDGELFFITSIKNPFIQSESTEVTDDQVVKWLELLGI